MSDEGLRRAAVEVIAGHTQDPDRHPPSGACTECSMLWPCHAVLLARAALAARSEQRSVRPGGYATPPFGTDRSRSEPRGEGLPDALRYHPVTGDADFAQATMQERLDTLADYWRSEGMRLAAEPRGEGLREATAIVNDGIRNGRTDEEIARAALAATPPAPALDVERLRLALRVLPSPMHNQVGHDEWRRRKAEDIAREYAALAPERQD